MSEDWSLTSIFGRLLISVRIRENHPDYRVWAVKFGKAGSSELGLQVLFHMEKGIWFGDVAYHVLTLKAAWDVGGLFYGPRPSFPGPAPQPVDRRLYVETLKQVAESFDFNTEVPEIWAGINKWIRERDEDGEDSSSIHNAVLLLSEFGLPATVEFRPGSFETPWVVAAWDQTSRDDERKFTFQGLRVNSELISFSPLNAFFRMIGYYRSRNQLLDLKNALDRRLRGRPGPKDWSPVKVNFMLQRGKDYGVEDFQPGEPGVRDL